jgi:hypothetical protein
LNEIVTQKESLISEIQATKKKEKDKLEKSNEKLIGKVTLGGSKHILWHHLFLNITIFRECINLVYEEYEMAMSSIQKCKTMTKELLHRPIEVAQNIINFMNMETKVDLQDLGVNDKLAIIISAKKFIYKHNFVQSVQSKVDLLLKKFKSFKSRFNELFKKDLLSFGDNEGKLISQEIYRDL